MQLQLRRLPGKFASGSAATARFQDFHLVADPHRAGPVVNAVLAEQDLVVALAVVASVASGSLPVARR